VFVDAPPTPEPTPPAPAPVVKKAPATKKAAAAKKSPEPKPLPAWVQPEEGGMCPGSHPVKAKLSSKIFHVPGGLSYPRVKADRCYTTEEAAVGDGLSKAKR
jgi:hypothetical protein